MEISKAPFLLAAAGLHVVLPLLAIFAPAPSFPSFALAPVEVDVEVEIPETVPPIPEVVPPKVREEAARSDQAPPAPRAERPSSATNIEPGPVPSTAPSVEPQSTGEPVASAPPARTSEYDGPPPAVMTGPTGGLPGLGPQAWAVPGAVPDMGRPAPAPTSSPAASVDRQAATKVLKDAIRERDKGLGLDLPAGGTVASSVRVAVQGADTPPESRATFEVRLSPTGQVLGVRVTSSSGGTSEMWARAAAAAAAALKGRTLALTSEYAKGAVVYVNVQSLLTLPDGSKSAITQKGAGATFDLSNIGAHMQKVVRSSFSVVAVK